MAPRGITRRRLLPLGAGLVLSGGGFQPMFAARSPGQAGPAVEGLAETNVLLMPERSGMLLRQALQARFDRGGGVAQRYDLQVGFGVGAEAIGIQSDSAVSRIRLSGIATWTLLAQTPQRSTLASGSARTTDSYDIIDVQLFAADMEQDMVFRRMAEALADQITLQLGAYFNHKAATGT
jgi:hypothetical protein